MQTEKKRFNFISDIKHYNPPNLSKEMMRFGFLKTRREPLDLVHHIMVVPRHYNECKVLIGDWRR